MFGFYDVLRQDEEYNETNKANITMSKFEIQDKEHKRGKHETSPKTDGKISCLENAPQDTLGITCFVRVGTVRNKLRLTYRIL